MELPGYIPIRITGEIPRVFLSELCFVTCIVIHLFRTKILIFVSISVKTSPDSPMGGAAAGGGAQPVPMEQELYEKAIPIHGDLMFHNFMSKLQENPGQILRYSRNASPILIAPLKELLSPVCQHCGHEMICEVQILPTIIEKLRLEATGESAPIDFGNVLVWTCVKSCWDTPDKMRTEQVVVQQES